MNCNIRIFALLSFQLTVTFHSSLVLASKPAPIEENVNKIRRELIKEKLKSAIAKNSLENERRIIKTTRIGTLKRSLAGGHLFTKDSQDTNIRLAARLVKLDASAAQDQVECYKITRQKSEGYEVYCRLYTTMPFDQSKYPFIQAIKITRYYIEISPDFFEILNELHQAQKNDSTTDILEN